MAWSPLQEFVTLVQAKTHLRLPDYDSPSAEDDDLQIKLYVAHEVVMDYLTQRVSDGDAWETTVDAWTAATVPKRVIAAILEQTAYLYRFRGDDTDEPNRAQGQLAPGVVMLLYRLRDPAVS